MALRPVLSPEPAPAGWRSSRSIPSRSSWHLFLLQLLTTSQLRVREDSWTRHQPGDVSMLLHFDKDTFQISCKQLILPRMSGIRRSPYFSCSGFLFFFGVTRSTSAAHDSASRNASRPPRFRSRQATQRAEGLV